MSTTTAPAAAGSSTATVWHIRVDLPPVDVDEDRAIALLEQLHDVRAGLIPGADVLAVTVVVEASTLRQAIATALGRVEDEVGAKAVGVEALTAAAIEQRLASPVVPDLVGAAEIAEILGVSRARVRQLAAGPGFPPAVAETTASGPLRVRSAVEEWAKTRRTSAGRPRKDQSPEA